ncbi:UbiH/UbiF family hydroxylase [Shinella sp. CPCC 100929]|uniref:UbiH/UbiF family hydroxylase n=1 Tax=Shinella lacus TaxID=2654216 RepID=A0ABT1R3I5_9HYPH|nr:UbiH/UbiF family hydroxylase [Shinella lacus]MCQ4629715.1 UbiH/UbiF family hydroxylase [Shinella lacus]
MKEFDIAIVGAGLAGNLAALSLADSGRSVALIAPPTRAADGRTTALMDQSIAFLKALGLWDEIARHAAALETMQILDGTTRLLRAPPVAFRSSEVGLPAFGYNIPNAPFLAVLNTQIAARDNIVRLESGVTAATAFEHGVELVLDDGERVTARLVVGADGKKSKIRDSAGIAVSAWSYPQAALVLNFAHERPHGNVSTEFHTESGPFTQVPLPGRRSSLVWVLPPKEAARLRELPVAELNRAVEERMQSMLGKVTVEGTPQSFPLSGMTARHFGKGRFVLVGEAAHAFPPIGAQGLNLSLRDIMALKDLIQEGDDGIGERFDRKRQADIRTRTMSVDLLNRSLLSDFLPVQFLRSAGLHLLSALGPLRSIVMREGIEPGGSLKAFRDGLRERVAREQA